MGLYEIKFSNKKEKVPKTPKKSKKSKIKPLETIKEEIPELVSEEKEEIKEIKEEKEEIKEENVEKLDEKPNFLDRLEEVKEFLPKSTTRSGKRKSDSNENENDFLTPKRRNSESEYSNYFKQMMKQLQSQNEKLYKITENLIDLQKVKTFQPPIGHVSASPANAFKPNPPQGELRVSPSAAIKPNPPEENKLEKERNNRKQMLKSMIVSSFY
jgi:hypothetical protein